MRLRGYLLSMLLLGLCGRLPAQVAPGISLPSTVPSSPSQSGSIPSAESLPSFPENEQNPDQQHQPQRRTGARVDRATDRSPEKVAARPDQLTEFQRMVAATAGRQLPIFGASLFQGVPSTFAPVDNVPVTPGYVIGPGDEIRLQVWGQVNQQGAFTVDRTGAISVPQLGTLHVAGIPFSGLSEFLRGQLGRVYRNFDLNVNLGQLRSIQVFVVGQARRPGSYTIGSLSTLLNALFESGGPLPTGSLRDIKVMRGGATVVEFDLYDLLLHGDKSKDVPLLPGDVIFIPPSGPQVALLGSVNNPAIYELRQETTVPQLLQLAGGKSNIAAGSTVRIERIYEHRMLSIEDVDLAKPDAPTLRNGDVVSVASIMDRFRDAVTLRGNVANPGRYVWHAGMRVSDLIPSKEVLVTRNYWRKRNELGQMAQDYSPVAESAVEGALQVHGNMAAPAADTTGRKTETNVNSGGGSVGNALAGSSGVFSAKTDVILSAPDIDWSYAVIERQSAVDLTTSLLPFNLGKVVLNGEQSQNLELLPGDVVTIFSTADVRVPASQQTRFVRLEGEFVASGVYSVRPGETLRGLLSRAGGFTSDAYLYASAFTRQSTKRVEQQRLNEYADQLEAQISSVTAGLTARAVSDRDAVAASAQAADARNTVARLRRIEPEGRIVLDLKPDSRGVESVPDLALEDGDRFVVPKVPSSVGVEGQVYRANAFVFERDRKMMYYLKEAGGPDRLADRKRAFVLRADGSVLSRQYGNVEHAPIFPGDTVVMPPQIDKRAVLRNLVDFATILGQFGVGVAAINLLR